MNYQSVFHLVKDICKKENIPLILIGGFAVNYYQSSRQSADADFLIKEEDFQKILPFLLSAGYKPDYNNKVFIRLVSQEGLLMMDIDFMFIDDSTFDKIIAAGQIANIAGCEFTVPSLEHLIALKLHSIKQNPTIRWNKDVMDIFNLAKVGHLDMAGQSFKELCLKYATEEIYEKILGGI